jgi:ParB family chromosome partitioning protein
MQVPIDDVVVKKRVRNDLGDIEALARSLEKFGQIHPIVISDRNLLIAGGRRLAAAKSLGWRTINATVVKAAGALSLLEYEVEENLWRQDLSPQEFAGASKRLQRLRNPGPFRRFFRWIAGVFKKLFRIEG